MIVGTAHHVVDLPSKLRGVHVSLGQDQQVASASRLLFAVVERAVAVLALALCEREDLLRFLEGDPAVEVDLHVVRAPVGAHLPCAVNLLSCPLCIPFMILNGKQTGRHENGLTARA